LLLRDTIIAAVFIGNLGEKTEFGESRGCQIDKRKVITEIANEFYSIKVLCLKYLDIYISSCTKEEKPLIVSYKTVLLKLLCDFITNTMDNDLIITVLRLFEKIQDVLDEPFERASMETYLFAILDHKYHEIQRLEEERTNELKFKIEVNSRGGNSGKGSRNNSAVSKVNPGASGVGKSKMAGPSGQNTSKNSIAQNNQLNETEGGGSSISEEQEFMNHQNFLEDLLAKNLAPRFHGHYELTTFLKKEEGLGTMIDMLINPFEAQLSPVVKYYHSVVGRRVS